MSRHTTKQISVTRCAFDSKNKVHVVGPVEVPVWATRFDEIKGQVYCSPDGGTKFPIRENIRIVQRLLEAAAK